MLKFLETLKDSAESTVDSAAVRVENVHRLIGNYVGSQARRFNPGAEDEADSAPRPTIYDVLRGVNREIGEFGTDIFEIIDDAKSRRDLENEDNDDAP